MLVAALGLVALTVVVVRHEAVGVLDGTFRDWVIAHRNGALTHVMVGATRFGSTPSLIVVALASAIWLTRLGRRGDGLLVVLGAAGIFLVGPVLKVFVERPRPSLSEHIVFVNSWSYPSVHSLNSMVVLGLLVVLALRGRTGRARAVVASVGVLLVLLIGFSRVYLGVHWPSDVLAGWLVGVLWLTICFTVANLMSGNSGTSGTVPEE
ncbi:undecaprenyl-diphosphatase [Actinophytocola oryzae]|uniref:Undecaprenyl-diphosphatase n=1 Tax=Actinophytocola oryzae TaxID=502181 RepID=A0A4V3FUG8_9PSEU|nr:undecaprenyl-diphosphatase [Actinophytocola oryzae]